MKGTKNNARKIVEFIDAEKKLSKAVLNINYLIVLRMIVNYLGTILISSL